MKSFGAIFAPDFTPSGQEHSFYRILSPSPGLEARSIINSGYRRRKVSAIWQFQQTGRWVARIAGRLSALISLHARVTRSEPTKAGLWSCHLMSPKGAPQKTQDFPSYQFASIARTKQPSGLDSICSKHCCAQ